MDSVVPVVEEFVSNTAADVKDCSLHTPSSKHHLLETTTDRPSSSPVADANPSRTAAALKTSEKTTKVETPKLLEPSTSVDESNDRLEDGKTVEHSQSVTLRAVQDTTHGRLAATASDVEIEGKASQAESLGDNTSAQQHIINSEDADLPETIESCSDNEGDRLGRASHDDHLETAVTKESPGSHRGEPVLTGKPSIFFEVGNSKQNEQHEDTDNIQKASIAEKEEAGDDSEGEAFGDDEDTVVETERHEDTPSVLPRSVPPHMRPTPKAPNMQHPSSHTGRVSVEKLLDVKYTNNH